MNIQSVKKSRSKSTNQVHVLIMTLDDALETVTLQPL